MTLDSIHVLLLGSLLATAAALVLTLSLVAGAALWGWSWAARFDALAASRNADTGVVKLSAELKPKPGKRIRGQLKRPSNGVRSVDPRRPS